MKALVVMIVAFVLAANPSVQAQEQAIEKQVETYNPQIKIPSNKSLTLSKLQSNRKYVNTLLTNQKTELIMGEVGAVKKVDKKPEEKKAHPYDQDKIAEPKTLHDYFINQLVETSKNIAARGTYLIAQEKGQDWKVPDFDAATAPLAHMFKDGVDQMNDRSIIEGMLGRAARCESGKLMSDSGKSLSAFEKNCGGTEKLITHKKAIEALDNPQLADRVKGVIDKNMSQILDYYKPELLQDWLPYKIEDGKDGALRKIITPEQFADCVQICFLKATKKFAEDNGAIVIAPAKYKPEYKGAFAAEDPQVAQASEKLSDMKVIKEDLGLPSASAEKNSKVTQTESVR